jgi:DNA-binding transcriptional MerR regulator
MEKVVIQGFPTPEVCRLTGVAPSTLDYWVRERLVSPSVRESGGRKRVTRFWSVGDVVLIRAIKALREAGCSLQILRGVKAELDSVGEQGIREQVLYWDGSDVIGVDKWGNLHSLRRKPRQQILHLVAIPLGDWTEDVRVELKSKSPADRVVQPARGTARSA